MGDTRGIKLSARLQGAGLVETVSFVSVLWLTFGALEVSVVFNPQDKFSVLTTRQYGDPRLEQRFSIVGDSEVLKQSLDVVAEEERDERHRRVELSICDGLRIAGDH